MSTKSPYVLPVALYNDDLKGDPKSLISDEELKLSQTLADMAKAIGQNNLAEYMRPPRLLGPHFEPFRLFARVKKKAKEVAGRAALVVFDRASESTILIWDNEVDSSLSRLVNMRLAGAWIVGIAAISNEGWACTYPEPASSPEEQLIFDGCLKLIVSECPPKLPEFYGEPEEATKTLQQYPWPESGPVSLDEIVLPKYTENGQIGESNAR
jgi:hypothetical protein